MRVEGKDYNSELNLMRCFITSVLRNYQKAHHEHSTKPRVPRNVSCNQLISIQILFHLNENKLNITNHMNTLFLNKNTL